MRKTQSFACRPAAAECLRAVLVAALFTAATAAFAGTPDWLRQAALAPVNGYAEDVDAVVLLDEEVISVTPSGEIRSTCRKAYKILRPSGRKFGTVVVHFDNDTQLTWLKAWSITANNEEYEVKEKDAIVTASFSEALYSDASYKLLQIPASQPGSVIGYEYQRRERPTVPQSLWLFQHELPVRRARFTLELPPRWAYSAQWFHHAALPPQSSGENRWTWELADVAPLPSEPAMPAWRAIAGHLGISLLAPGSTPLEASAGWRQIGRWYADLSANRREVNPQIRDKVRELVAGDDRPLEKIRRLASYVQRAIRYVAIEIGIGGYQPHSAPDVFSSGYGDCKDKATLLSAMLREIGVDSYYVLVNSERGVVAPDFPTMLSFDHVILAIRLPPDQEAASLFATAKHEKLGPLIFFDPTDSSTPLGYLPPVLQASEALLLAGDGGELLRLPLLSPVSNRVLRTGTLKLDSFGLLEGTVREVRAGAAAAALRTRLLRLPKSQRQKVFQDLLSELLDGAVLTAASISDLSSSEASLGLEYSFRAPDYAQRAGDLLLFRACALCRRSSSLLEGKPRKQPVTYEGPASESDLFSISFPDGYVPDELPQAVKLDQPFASYRSDSRVEASALQFSRTFEIKQVHVPLERIEHLKNFFRQVADDQRAYVVLKAPAGK